DRVIHGPAFAELQHSIIRTIEHFQQGNPLVSGIAKEELRKRVGSLSDVFEAAIGSLVREKKIEVASEVVRKPGRGVSMKDEEAESKLRIEKAFASAGLQVPALADVLAGLKIDRVRAQKIVTLLLREKLLIKVSDELVFHRSALEQLRERMAAYKSKSAKIDVAQFKSLTGVTRKYAIPLLEYLDRERVTKRIGDAREIL
ncbi:MAG: SelB C-terminal domain-containing protein, partial [Candidatus Sulfotelmatobacter sp.]